MWSMWARWLESRDLLLFGLESEFEALRFLGEWREWCVEVEGGGGSFMTRRTRGQKSQP